MQQNAVLVEQVPSTPLTPFSAPYIHPYQLSFKLSPQETTFNVVSGVAYFPKSPNPNRKDMIDCGEDAYFVSNGQVDNGRVCSLGVSDGVGGYQQYGIDPSKMAWALMEGSNNYLAKDGSMSCKQALIDTYNDIVKKKSVVIGGATACLVTMRQGTNDSGNSVLKMTAANLGDSAFMVIRDGNIVLRSTDQIHYFNCPYQLSVPQNIGAIHDDPDRSDEYSFDLIKGDFLVLGTDGLTDNLFDEDVAKIVTQRSKAGGDVNIIAKDLLRHAAVRARTRGIKTPFSEYAQKNNFQYLGGKLDDITVVVAQIN